MSGQVGLVVHPRRDIEAALDAVRDWASKRDSRSARFGSRDRRALSLSRSTSPPATSLSPWAATEPPSPPCTPPPPLPARCSELPAAVSACTSVAAPNLGSALERVADGDWTPQSLAGLDIAIEAADVAVAINDVAVVRNGTGQVIIEITVDGELYARTAGDGLVVATPIGSSAYTMAAGGPVLLPETHAMVLTPLARHGGVSPPLVVGSENSIGLSVESGYGGSRFEVDGQLLPVQGLEASVRLRRDYATMITLGDQEPMLTGLRRRGLVVDSPRILARAVRPTRETPSRSNPTCADPT
jgi:NAD+ kinase